MKSKMFSKSLVAGLLFSLLSAGISRAAGAEGNERMSRIGPAETVAARRAEARRVETFRSERTDDWLCLYASPFFCSNLFPTLTTTPNPPQTSSTPTRGRN